MVTLPTYLPIQEAARKYGLDEARIRTLINDGIIKAAMIGETIVVAESEVQQQGKALRKEDLPEWKKHAHLKGYEIGVGEGARKYDIPVSTLHRWAMKNIVKIVRREGQKVLLDEADVAYCAEVYSRRKGQGKWLFDENGLPYKPKTGPLVMA